jgi:hypothetical protein
LVARLLEDSSRRSARPGWSKEWAVWLGLFVLLLVSAATFRTETWPEWFGDETGYLLQAESVARDLDLRYTDRDRERLVQRHGRRVGDTGLALEQKGEVVLLDRPLAYPLLLAPFVRLAPMQGAALLNVLLLTAAAWLAARTLSRRLGAVAPLLVVLFVFGSVTFRYVFVALPDILLLAATVAAFALAYDREESVATETPEIYRAPDEGWDPVWRWLAVGALLVIPAVHHPLYLGLFVPAAVATPRARRRRSLMALVAGAAAMLVLGALAKWMLTGTWAAVVPDGLGDMWPTLTAERVVFDGKLIGWNLLYFLAGRSVGVLPYFLPVLLALGAWSKSAPRSTLVLSAAAMGLLFVLVAPFNFFGGPGAIGNRWLLPLVGALWLVPARRPHRGWIVATVVLAALFMWPSWRAPRAYPVGPDGNYRHSAGLAQRFLPYETTQRELPSVGELRQGVFWVRATGRLTSPAGIGERFEVEGEGPTELLVASPVPLVALHLEFGPTSPGQIEVTHGSLGDTVFRPDGGVGFDLFAPTPRARHPMWWSDESQSLYFFQFVLPGATAKTHAFAVSFATWKDLETEE